jgi:O-antigen/teichoic acid export membrane protein
LADRALGGPTVRRVIENSGWSFAATAVGTAGLFVETVILARYLSPAGYGVLLVLIAVPELVQKILAFRVLQAMTKYLGEFLAQSRHSEAVAIVKLLWLLEVGVTGLAFLIVLAISGWAADAVIDRPDLAHAMVIYAGGLVFASFGSAAGTILRVLDRFALSFAVGSAYSIVRVASVLTAVALGGDLIAIVVARAIAEVIGTLISGGAAAKALAGIVWEQRHAPIRVLRDRAREITYFLVNTNLAGVLRAIATKLDVVVVGLLATTSTVSLYKVAIQVGTAPLLLGDALFVAVFPSFARSFATRRRSEMREVATHTSILVAAVVLPALALFAFVGTPLMGLVFGEPYRDAASAALLCLVGATAYVVFFWAQPLMLTVGRAGPLLRRGVLATLAQFAVLAILVPPLGADGAGAALGTAYLFGITLQLIYIRRQRLFEAEPEAGGLRAAAAAGAARS